MIILHNIFILKFLDTFSLLIEIEVIEVWHFGHKNKDEFRFSFWLFIYEFELLKDFSEEEFGLDILFNNIVGLLLKIYYNLK